MELYERIVVDNNRGADLFENGGDTPNNIQQCFRRALLNAMGYLQQQEEAPRQQAAQVHQQEAVSNASRCPRQLQLPQENAALLAEMYLPSLVPLSGGASHHEDDNDDSEDDDTVRISSATVIKLQPAPNAYSSCDMKNMAAVTAIVLYNIAFVNQVTAMRTIPSSTDRQLRLERAFQLYRKAQALLDEAGFFVSANNNNDNDDNDNDNNDNDNNGVSPTSDGTMSARQHQQRQHRDNNSHYHHPVLDVLSMALWNNMGQACRETGNNDQAEICIYNLIDFCLTINVEGGEEEEESREHHHRQRRTTSPRVENFVLAWYKSQFLLNAMALGPMVVAPAA